MMAFIDGASYRANSGGIEAGIRAGDGMRTGVGGAEGGGGGGGGG